MYLSWKRFLHRNIELHPVEYAGRGQRIHELLFMNMGAMVGDVYEKISIHLNEGPYAFLGHSMGTIIAYELLHKIHQNKQKGPVHIFFSGRFPPFLEDEKADRIYDLPDEAFISNIMQYDGTDSEVFNNQYLREFFLPVLRADYKMVGTYRHTLEIPRINCDISILSGNEDAYVIGKDMSRWQECTNGTCRFFNFEGGHFFINQHKDKIAQIVNDTLLNNCK